MSKNRNPTSETNYSSKRKVSHESNMSNKKVKWGRHSRVSSVDEANVIAMFDEIADEDDNSIATMEGISKLAEHLGIDPMEDIRILVLLYKLGAKSKPAQISRSEWISGCEKLQLDSVDKLKMLLPSLDLGFMERSEFREFHKVRQCISYFRDYLISLHSALLMSW
jgi:hypothetical protein